MKIQHCKIPEVVLITPTRLGDSRGYFSETFRDQWFRNNICDVTFVQENESFSLMRGTVRGLHFQSEPAAQGKLVRVVSGAIFDVAVDLRAGSPSYCLWVGAVLSAENGVQLWIPEGFAHGFATLAPKTMTQYKVTAPYSPEHDRGLLWNDPAIGIDWPIRPEEAIISAKDRDQPVAENMVAAFKYEHVVKA
jgi:dTDP-4-dehydrorhamnose 3,5-epimerase